MNFSVSVHIFFNFPFPEKNIKKMENGKWKEGWIFRKMENKTLENGKSRLIE